MITLLYQVIIILPGLNKSKSNVIALKCRTVFEPNHNYSIRLKSKQPTDYVYDPRFKI